MPLHKKRIRGGSWFVTCTNDSRNFDFWRRNPARRRYCAPPMSLVIFPSVPFGPREIDPDFEAEQSAAKRAGFATALVDHTRGMSR